MNNQHMPEKKVNTKLQQLRKKVDGFVKDQKNEHFKSTFFNINQMIDKLMEELQELNLMIMQPMRVENGRTVLRLEMIDMDDGNILASSEMLLPDDLNPQKIGSAITYYRRYMLQTLMWWEAMDDDGNDAASPDEPKKASEKQVDLIKSLVDARGGTIEQACAWLKVEKLEDLTASSASEVIEEMKKQAKQSK